ncbi:MAG: hypothetical protein FJ130_04120 [Deltaproteobacteria bacterium]|nr:hypothetical protein [Deltaproteobacteria bacterium]
MTLKNLLLIQTIAGFSAPILFGISVWQSFWETWWIGLITFLLSVFFWSGIARGLKPKIRDKVRESRDVELFKLSENQCKKIADMMVRNRNPEEKELVLNEVLRKPMYLESPLKGWRELSKEEQVEHFKKQEPLTLSVYQEGEVIFHIKLKDGIKGFIELTVETMEDEEKKKEVNP